MKIRKVILATLLVSLGIAPRMVSELMSPMIPLDALSTIASAQNRTEKRTSTSIREDSTGTRERTWRHIENDKGLEIKIRGEIEFTEDYTDVKRLSPNGYIRVEDTGGAVTRRFEATPNADGSLKRVNLVGGEARPFDAEAKSWLAGLLTEAVRQSGFDAPARVARIFKQGGASAVLEEITRIRSDYAKGLYFMELLKTGPLDSATAQRAIRQAAREISSDYEKANVLLKYGEVYMSNRSVHPDFAEAVATINSDYERGRVLSALLKNKDVSRDVLARVLKISEGISSEYEKAQLLIGVANAHFSDRAVWPAFFAAVATIRADYEHGRVLAAVVNKNRLDKESLALTLKSAATMSSDYEKAKVLLMVAAASEPNDANLRNALIEAAKTINSEYERGRVLAAVFK